MAPEEAQGTAEAAEVDRFLGTGPDGQVLDDTPDEGGESAPEQTEAQETEQQEAEEQQTETGDTAGEQPAPFVFGGREFKSQEEAEKSYKEMQGFTTKAQASQGELERLRQFFDSHQGQQTAPAPKPEEAVKAGAKFLAMTPEQLIDHIDKGGYPALQEAVVASLQDSGVLKEARSAAAEEARQEILQALGPALDVLADVNDDRQIAALTKKYGDSFKTLEPKVRELLKAPGNQMGAEEIYAVLAMDRLKEVEEENAALKKGQRAKAGAAGAASAATRGSSKPGAAGAKPAGSKGGGDDFDDFFGSEKEAKDTIPGTGLVEA